LILKQPVALFIVLGNWKEERGPGPKKKGGGRGGKGKDGRHHDLNNTPAVMQLGSAHYFVLKEGLRILNASHAKLIRFWLFGECRIRNARRHAQSRIELGVRTARIPTLFSPTDTQEEAI